MNAQYVFDQNDGDVTKRYYAEMNQKGPLGELAVALFRAQKRSTAAKRYRGRRYTRSAYDVKNWSLSEICRILTTYRHDIPYQWGWARDPSTPGYEWVLYIDLPTGQCSFHSHTRLTGPNYPGKWDYSGGSAIRIVYFCNFISQDGPTTITPAAPAPEQPVYVQPSLL